MAQDCRHSLNNLTVIFMLIDAGVIFLSPLCKTVNRGVCHLTNGNTYSESMHA